MFVAVSSGEVEMSTTACAGLNLDGNFHNIDSRRILACYSRDNNYWKENLALRISFPLLQTADILIRVPQIFEI